MSSLWKITKNQWTFDQKSMQIWNWKKTTKNCLKILIWEGLGPHLGRVWDGLGPLLGALGPLLFVFWTFKISLFSNMGPTWAPRGPLDRFWEGLGRIWVRFGDGLGWNLEGFGLFFSGCGHFLAAFGKMWPCCSKAFKLDPRTDPRSITIRRPRGFHGTPTPVETPSQIFTRI